MSSVLSSSGVVLATAMAVSGAVIFLALRRENNSPPPLFSGIQASRPTEQILRSCLSSGGGERKKKKKKKKRVKFADGVKDQNQSGNGEIYRKDHRKSTSTSCCRVEIQQIPANRVALYNGILKDRVQRV